MFLICTETGIDLSFVLKNRSILDKKTPPFLSTKNDCANGSDQFINPGSAHRSRNPKSRSKSTGLGKSGLGTITGSVTNTGSGIGIGSNTTGGVTIGGGGGNGSGGKGGSIGLIGISLGGTTGPVLNSLGGGNTTGGGAGGSGGGRSMISTLSLSPLLDVCLVPDRFSLTTLAFLVDVISV